MDRECFNGLKLQNRCHASDELVIRTNLDETAGNLWRYKFECNHKW